MLDVETAKKAAAGFNKTFGTRDSGHLAVVGVVYLALNVLAANEILLIDMPAQIAGAVGVGGLTYAIDRWLDRFRDEDTP